MPLVLYSCWFGNGMGIRPAKIPAPAIPENSRLKIQLNLGYLKKNMASKTKIVDTSSSFMILQKLSLCAYPNTSLGVT